MPEGGGHGPPISGQEPAAFNKANTRKRRQRKAPGSCNPVGWMGDGHPVSWYCDPAKAGCLADLWPDPETDSVMSRLHRSLVQWGSGVPETLQDAPGG
jgi:hypothetical protein